MLASKKGYLNSSSSKAATARVTLNLEAKNYSIEDKRVEDDDKYRSKRDRYTGSGPVMPFREKDGYDPDIKLEYIDDLGREMSKKEAFRCMGVLEVFWEGGIFWGFFGVRVVFWGFSWWVEFVWDGWGCVVDLVKKICLPHPHKQTHQNTRTNTHTPTQTSTQTHSHKHSHNQTHKHLHTNKHTPPPHTNPSQIPLSPIPRQGIGLEEM